MDFSGIKIHAYCHLRFSTNEALFYQKANKTKLMQQIPAFKQH